MFETGTGRVRVSHAPGTMSERRNIPGEDPPHDETPPPIRPAPIRERDIAKNLPARGPSISAPELFELLGVVSKLSRS